MILGYNTCKLVFEHSNGPAVVISQNRRLVRRKKATTNRLLTLAMGFLKVLVNGNVSLRNILLLHRPKTTKQGKIANSRFFLLNVPRLYQFVVN